MAIEFIIQCISQALKQPQTPNDSTYLAKRQPPYKTLLCRANALSEYQTKTCTASPLPPMTPYPEVLKTAALQVLSQLQDFGDGHLVQLLSAVKDCSVHVQCVPSIFIC